MHNHHHNHPNNSSLPPVNPLYQENQPVPRHPDHPKNIENHKPAIFAPVLDQIVVLNIWQRLYRILFFCLLVVVIIFDIWFLSKTNNFVYFDHFNVMISFFLIPFILAALHNNLFHYTEAYYESSFFHPLLGLFYRLTRLIGFEHFTISLFTGIYGRSTFMLDHKFSEANIYHTIFGSQIVLMTQLHAYFRFHDDSTGYFWIATPIILHAIHISLLGAEIRMANKTVVKSFLFTFFHIDFLQNLFEGVGRAILVGATAIVIVDGGDDFGHSGVLTRQAFAIDALAAAGFCILAMIFMIIKTGMLSGIVYGISFFFQLMAYRCDSNVMKLYNNFQRKLSLKVRDIQLRFQYYTAIIWRFCELIAIWAALLDNNDRIYDFLSDGKHNRISLRDILLVGLIFDAIYLAVLMVEFVRYCVVRKTFNAIGIVLEPAQQVQQEIVVPVQQRQIIINNPMVNKEVIVDRPLGGGVAHADARTERTEVVISEHAAPVRLPAYINEEARDFEPRNQRNY